MTNRNYEEKPTPLPEFSRIGHTLSLGGVLFTGMDEVQLYLMPNLSWADITYQFSDEKALIARLSVQEWSALLKRSDDPLIFVPDETGTAKSWVRKLQYQISGDVQQRVWARDGHRCMYCQRPMGEVTLSIDHWVPLELGGKNEPSNFISCCRRENKDKGNMPPEEWCKKRNLDFDFYVDYLSRF